jgi:hypothetical protein
MFALYDNSVCKDDGPVWRSVNLHCMGLEGVYSCWQYNPFLCGSRENVTILTSISAEPVWIIECPTT